MTLGEQLLVVEPRLALSFIRPLRAPTPVTLPPVRPFGRPLHTTLERCTGPRLG